MGKPYEFHFQEGFGGQSISIEVDGLPNRQFLARTRMQIGLAQIETLSLKVGQTVTVNIPELSLSQSHKVTKQHRWISVNLINLSLILKGLDASPGYV
jgi:hypothetical protein